MNELDETNTGIRKPAINPARQKLQLLVKFAGRAGNKNPAWDSAFTILHALYDACLLAALGAVSALGGVHDLFAVGCFCDFCHVLSSYPLHTIRLRRSKPENVREAVLAESALEYCDEAAE